MNTKHLILYFFFLLTGFAEYDFTFAVLKYKGGGDWYEGKIGAINLMSFVNKRSTLRCRVQPMVVEPDDSSLSLYPFLYMTGHGNVHFTETEVRYLRKYLLSGGFLFANDDYGMDKSFRSQIKSIFPKKKFVQLPISHKIFHIYYDFPSGAPKIHKHDGGPPLILAIYHNNRIVVLYAYNTDIGDGWAPYQVHKDPEEARLKALKFGLNVIMYSMTQ